MNKLSFSLKWKKDLQILKNNQLYRQLQAPAGFDFSSNDYLSLNQSLSIRKKLLAELKKDLLLSSGGSRLIRGHTIWHEKTEELFKKQIKRAGVLFFNSGYMANLGLISSIAKKAVIFSDELNHASLIEGCRLSKRPRYIYPHNNMKALAELLKKIKFPEKIIVTESLFSMDGDFAPLEELSSLALKHKALLIIDEAHATGLYGFQGAGLASRLKKKSHVITVHPCGKALSSNGAFIAGPAFLKAYLINHCKSFIYTSSASPITMAHLYYVLKFLKQNPDRKILLRKKARFFRKKIQNIVSLQDKNSDSPIVPIIIGSAKRSIDIANSLQKKGYDIKAIRQPSVPKNTERLRICIHYNHSYTQLEKLTSDLKTLLFPSL